MKKLLSVLCAIFAGSVLYAQSADVITDILASEKATVGQVAYLCAVQQQLMAETEDYDIAVETLVSYGQLPEGSEASDAISLADTAYMLSKNWTVKGGLMYLLTKGSKRYAFRQFVSDGVISSNAEPSASLSGSEVLALYSSCLGKYGDFDLSAVSMEAE